MSVSEKFQQLEAHASRLIIGQAHLINRMLIALLCDGHLLVEGTGLTALQSRQAHDKCQLFVSVGARRRP